MTPDQFYSGWWAVEMHRHVATVLLWAAIGAVAIVYAAMTR